MTVLREARLLPVDVEASDATAERLLFLAASHLQPGLEGSVGAIDWRDGSGEGTDWTAQGHLPDGTFVCIALRMPTREVTLWVDTAFALRPALRSSRWVASLAVGIVAGGVGVGVAWQSTAWGFGAVVLGFATWIAIDVRAQIRAERVAQSRPLDAEAWRCRFELALADACRAGRDA